MYTFIQWSTDKKNLCLLMCSACHQHCLAYISNMVQSLATSTHRQGLRSSTCLTYVVP